MSYSRTCNKQHVWGRPQKEIQSKGWWSRELWDCNDCMALKVRIKTLQSDGAETVYEQVVEPDPPEPYVPEPFSPFGRPASGFHPVTHEDFQKLQGEPKPLKIMHPVSIEELDDE